MKRVLGVLVTLLIVFVFSACDAPVEEQEVLVNANNNTIGMLSYISASFLDENIVVDTNVSLGLVQLSADKEKEEPKLALEDELDRVNIYVDKLKRFIENGTEGFGTIVEQSSDREAYEYMIQILVDEDEFVLYYNIDLDTFDIEGIFILDGVEYEIVIEDSLYDLKEEENESKKNIKLMVRNGADLLVVEYEMKQEENETKQLFSIVSNIDGEFHILEIEIKNEENEYVLSIIEDDKEYTFKSETDEDGKVSYKLEYLIDGVKGKVQIIEKTNDEGEIYYVYRIQEKNEKIEIELEDPDNVDDSE